MQTFDHVLLKRIEEDRIDYEEALKASGRPQDFKLMAQSTGLGMPRREGAVLSQ
jgi:twitching motility protein PilT